MTDLGNKFHQIRTKRGVTFPHLHHIFNERYYAGPETLSRCTDEANIFNIGEPDAVGRSDSLAYQFATDRDRYPKHFTAWNLLKSNMYTEFLHKLCPEVKERFVIYGTIGSGSKDPGTLRFMLTMLTAHSLWVDTCCS
jgi:hypothetical protein